MGTVIWHQPMNQVLTVVLNNNDQVKVKSAMVSIMAVTTLLMMLMISAIRSLLGLPIAMVTYLVTHQPHKILVINPQTLYRTVQIVMTLT